MNQRRWNYTEMVTTMGRFGLALSRWPRIPWKQQKMLKNKCSRIIETSHKCWLANVVMIFNHGISKMATVISKCSKLYDTLQKW